MNAEDTVDRWEEEERAVRARLAATAGYARPDQVIGRTGLEIFEAIFAGELPRPPIGDTLDFVPIHVERGLAVFQRRPQKKYDSPSQRTPASRTRIVAGDLVRGRGPEPRRRQTTAPSC